MKKILPLFVIILLISNLKSKAQGGNVGQLIRGGPADATLLVDAYSESLFKGFGNVINGGWANTARTKKFRHFDFRISASIAIVPTADKTYSVDDLGLSSAIKTDVSTNYAGQTFAGSKNPIQTVMDVYDANGKQISSFVLPAGQSAVIPAPIVQATIGLPYNTDVTLRGIPSVSLPNSIGTVSMIGVGLKHNILQDFAGSGPKDIAPIDVSIAFGYTRLNYNQNLTVAPDAGAQPISTSQSTDFSNQKMVTHFDGYTGQVIVSKKIGKVTPFLALGYQLTNTSLVIQGNYPLTTNATNGQKFYESFNNPVYIDQTTTNGARADLGFQVELGFFRIYGSFGRAQYNTVNAGIGFGL